MSELIWRTGDPETRRIVDAWWSDGLEAAEMAATLDESLHRRVLRVADGPHELLVKHYRAGTGPHPVRERFKSAVGRSPCDREWRGLDMLAGAHVPVPVPLGRARTEQGDDLLVMESIRGATLWSLLEGHPDEARSLVLELADRVAELHRAGFVHGDLQPGQRPDRGSRPGARRPPANAARASG